MDGSLEISGACFERAVAHHQAGELEKAIASYKEAITHFPEHQQAWNNMGTAHLTLKQVTEAIAAYQEAVRIDPGYAAAAYNLGTAYQAEGRNKEAYKWFWTADQLRPDDSHTLSKLAVLAEIEHLYEFAAHLFERVVALEPNRLVALCGMARCLAQSGQLEAALQAIDRILALNPQDAAVWFQVGQTYMQMKEWNQAILAFERSAAIAPQAMDIHMQLTLANFRAGRFSTAFDLCQDVLNAYPNFGAAVMIQAQALKGLGRLDQAEELAKRGSELPGNGPAWIELALREAPALTFGRAAIQRSRERFMQLLDDAEAFGSRIKDPSLQIENTAFYFAYQGQNDLPLMQRLAKTYLHLAPDLEWVAPHCETPAMTTQSGRP